MVLKRIKNLLKLLRKKSSKKTDVKIVEYAAYDIIELYFNFTTRNFSEEEVTKAKNWIVAITGFDRDFQAGQIDRETLQFVNLIVSANRHDRLRSVLEKMKNIFCESILPNWKSYYNFYFFNIVHFNNMFDLLSDQALEKLQNVEKIEEYQVELSFWIHGFS